MALVQFLSFFTVFLLTSGGDPAQEYFEVCDQESKHQEFGPDAPEGINSFQQVYRDMRKSLIQWCEEEFGRNDKQVAQTLLVNRAREMPYNFTRTAKEVAVKLNENYDGFNFTMSMAYNDYFGCEFGSPGIDPEGKAGKRISAINNGSHEFQKGDPLTTSKKDILNEFVQQYWSNHSAALLISHGDELVTEKYYISPWDNAVWTWGNYSEEALNYRTRFHGTLPFAILSLMMGIRAHEQELDLANTFARCPELDTMQKYVLNMTISAILESNLKQSLSTMDDDRLVYQVVIDHAQYVAKCILFEHEDIMPIDPEGIAHFSLLSRELRYTFADTVDGRAEYAAYPWEKLFSKIGANSFIFEADTAGNFQYNGIWATPRDYLRFGMMLAQGGSWQGEQLIPSLEKFLQEGRHVLHKACPIASGWSKGFFFHDGPPAWYAVASDPTKWNTETVVYNMIAICPSCNMSIVHIGKARQNMDVYGFHKNTFCDGDPPNGPWWGCTLREGIDDDWCTEYAERITQFFREYQMSSTTKIVTSTSTSTTLASSTTTSTAFTTSSSTTSRTGTTTSTAFTTSFSTTSRTGKGSESDIDEASGMKINSLIAMILMQVTLGFGC